MLGSHYQISFNQVLESERRLQFSNLFKVFDIKYGLADNVPLEEYLIQFADDCECISDEKQLDIEPYVTILDDISLIELEVSQIEWLIYIAGYAAFSFIKK
ncbi:hypothetical protein LOD99_8014 [Oopsacas minuta]|uniref:Uncharacterized protein n=1 Tax=Oopsacas minuta TaxID=111878 RepID=A0AAV7JJK3_9METZ|nr:hypothetical protein LOD99_8014 [Oopsacas minuta]